MKKVLAIILTLAMLFALSTVAFAASSPGPLYPLPQEESSSGGGVSQGTTDGTTVTTNLYEEKGLTVKEVEVVTPKGEEITQMDITVTDEYDPEVSGEIDLPAKAAADDATTIRVEVPEDGAFKLSIPVPGADETTVAVCINEDGTETIIKTTLPTEDGVIFPVENGKTYVIRNNAKEFIDDEGWYEEPIAFVAAREIFLGTSDITFEPETPMTRGMLCTVLARYAGATLESTGSDWYVDGVQWAIDNGVSDGTNPEQLVTREQMVAMLYRFAGSPEVTCSLDEFTDADDISVYASPAMQWAVSVGIIQGMGNGTIAPQGTATRGQLAAVMERFVKLTA